LKEEKNMLITVSACIQKCADESAHYAAVFTLDGGTYPFLTKSQGKKILWNLFEKGVILGMEFSFLAYEVINLNLPKNTEEMVKNLGVPIDVAEEACQKISLYIQKILEHKPMESDSLPVM